MLTLKEPEDYDAKYKKWSVADINYFAVIGRTISALLKKQAYI